MSDAGGDVLSKWWIEPYEVPVAIPFLLLFCLVRFTLVKILYVFPVSTLPQRVTVDLSRISEDVFIVRNISESAADRCR